MLQPSEVESYHATGFVLCRGLLPQVLVRECLAEIEAIFRDQAVKMGRLSNGDTLDDVIRAVMLAGTPERTWIYHFVRNIRAIRLVETLEEIRGVLASLGFRQPINFETPSLRFDVKGEEKFLTLPHQDIRSIRTPRCTTIWFPLSKVDEAHGSIAVYPGSHRRGLLPHELENGHIAIPSKSLSGEPVIVAAEPGDVVFMSSFCVHKSHPNRSSKIKINAQFFCNDALEARYDDEYQRLAAIPDYRELTEGPHEVL